VCSTHRNQAGRREEGAGNTRRQWLLRSVMLIPIACLVGIAGAELARKAAIDWALQGIRSVGGVYARDETERDRPVVSIDLGSYLIDDTGKVHRRGQAGDTLLALLVCFDRLRELSLEGSAVTDAGLRHIGRFSSVQRLSLRGTVITDAGLTHLRRLTSLTLLDLRETRCTEARIAELRAALPGAVILFGNDD
jgi:hypothetical protein